MNSIIEKRIITEVQQLFNLAAQEIAHAAHQAIKEKEKFTIVLSGGKTPLNLYQTLASKKFKDSIPWKKTFFFWGDERMVDIRSQHSNYGTAARFFLNNPELKIPDANIFPMTDGIMKGSKAAIAYEKKISNFFKIREKSNRPVFDMILLGMGNDGHTASLFPGQEASSAETSDWVKHVFVTEAIPAGERLTLTLPVINKAKQVIFLVTGDDKQTVLKKIWNNREKAKELYPAAMVEPQDYLLWLTDQSVD